MIFSGNDIKLKAALLMIPLGIAVVGSYFIFKLINQENSKDKISPDSEVSNEFPRIPLFRTGDLVFLSPGNDSTETIAALSGMRSAYNHVGIIFVIDQERFVYEALERVQFTPYEDWVSEIGYSRKMAVVRLANYDSLLTSARLDQLLEVARKYEGILQDSLFEWSSERMYNSELVWKLFNEALGIELCKLATIGDYEVVESGLFDNFMAAYGTEVLLDEKAVLPVDLIQSPLLKLVLIT